MNSCKNEFEEWLRRKRRLSNESVGKYGGAIGGYLSNLAKQLDVHNKCLFDIKNPGEFRKTKIVLESCDAFIEQNTRGHNMYSSALNRYSEFLEYYYKSHHHKVI